MRLLMLHKSGLSIKNNIVIFGAALIRDWMHQDMKIHLFNLVQSRRSQHVNVRTMIVPVCAKLSFLSLFDNF